MHTCICHSQLSFHASAKEYIFLLGYKCIHMLIQSPRKNGTSNLDQNNMSNNSYNRKEWYLILYIHSLTLNHLSVAHCNYEATSKYEGRTCVCYKHMVQGLPKLFQYRYPECLLHHFAMLICMPNFCHQHIYTALVEQTNPARN